MSWHKNGDGEGAQTKFLKDLSVKIKELLAFLYDF